MQTCFPSFKWTDCNCIKLHCKYKKCLSLIWGVVCSTTYGNINARLIWLQQLDFCGFMVSFVIINFIISHKHYYRLWVHDLICHHNFRMPRTFLTDCEANISSNSAPFVEDNFWQCFNQWKYQSGILPQSLYSVKTTEYQIAELVKLSPLLVEERGDEASKGLGLHVPLLAQLIKLVPKHQTLVPAQTHRP